MGSAGEAVYATLLMSDSYLPGAMVLAHSLRDAGSKAKLVCLVTPDSVQASTIDELKTMYNDIVPVTKILNKTPANLYLMDRPDLISTFTKIALWKQTQYSHIVYIDADVVALRAPDELLKLDTNFAAVPDIGWPDCFNSGVIVLKPNVGDYYSLLALAQRGISFDGADQGLLNMHFRNWERMSFGYNCTPSGNYQYVPAYRHFQSSISLVHFIGQDKPWTLGRDSKRSAGVYDELLGRWWASYDRHYRFPTSAYISGQGTAPTTTQQYVHGESTSASFGFSSSIPSIEVTGPLSPPEGAATTTEKPFTDQPELQESIGQGHVEPIATIEQRRFSAPQAEWDAARAPPPAESRPEAVNFPVQQYEFSYDPKPFEAPASYPEAPKDMYYQVPETKPSPSARPPAIFPWETRQAKPTRVFPNAPSPAPEPVHETTSTVPSTSTSETAPSKKETPPTPTIAISPADAWQTYTRSNAWDEMPDIERYIQALQDSRRGKVQVIHNTEPEAEHVLSSGAEEAPAPTQPDRRPSMKITDFPTEVERPSLPVTPAPVRRPTFWGEERDELGQLPAAEGVPKQDEWNPSLRLEELQRRQSEVLLSPQSAPKELPQRDMPGSPEATKATPVLADKPTFVETGFGSSTTKDDLQEDMEDPMAPAVETNLVEGLPAGN